MALPRNQVFRMLSKKITRVHGFPKTPQNEELIHARLNGEPVRTDQSRKRQTTMSSLSALRSIPLHLLKPRNPKLICHIHCVIEHSI